MQEEKLICKLCGRSVENIEDHIKEYHGMEWIEYWYLSEKVLPSMCWRCNTPRYPLSPWVRDNYFLPCGSCLTDKLETRDAAKATTEAMRGYLEQIERRPYWQYLIVHPEILKENLGATLEESEDLLKKLFKKSKIKPGKETSWEIISTPGAPLELSERNLDNLSIEATEDLLYTRITDYLWEINLGSRKLFLRLPDICDYDANHHSRNSFLNPNSKRFTKRIRISDRTCVRLWNTKYPWTKSLIQLSLPNSVNAIDPDFLTSSEIRKIKLIIFREKTIFKRIQEVLLELSKSVSYIRDTILFRGKIDCLSQGIGVSITWTPEPIQGPKSEGTISIL